MNRESLVYCGFGVYYDPVSNERFEKTASGGLKKIDDGAAGYLEREFVKEGMTKLASEQKRKV